MALIHTLLFMIREDMAAHDLNMIEKCLKSLEKSTYKTVVAYNQGFWDNEKLKEYLKSYQLDCIVIGEGVNVGIVIGRQRCFEYIWKEFPEVPFTTELHTDMVFTSNWEDPLVAYLKNHDEEPMICCSTMSSSGHMFYGDTCQPTLPPDDIDEMEAYLAAMKRDEVVYGFTHPCVHRMAVLKEVGGYDARFFPASEGFDDDSLHIGYYYYYGTRVHWRPKVNLASVVFHPKVGQRLGTYESMLPNLNGLYRQYGRMGFKALSELHRDEWAVGFFTENYNAPL